MLAVDSDLQSTLTSCAAYLAVVAAAFYFSYRNRRRHDRAAQLAATGIVLPNIVPLHPTIPSPAPRRMEMDEPATRQEPIDHVRDLLGPVPRAFSREIDTYLDIRKPVWMTQHDPLAGVYKRQKRVRREGVVVWGVFVQVNQQNFKPGPVDFAGSVIYSLDPYYDANPGELQAMAGDLFMLKGSDQADAEASTFARMLTLEHSRGMGLAVPRRFTGGRKVMHCSMVLPRKHLPAGFVTQNILPVWVDPSGLNGLLVVPAAYWPASLLDFWSRTNEPAPTTPAQPKQAEE